MKTLIVKYLPSGERSNTKKFLDLFMKELGDRPYETVDLLKQPIPFFNEESIAAYGKRNYMGVPLSEQERKSLAEHDRLVKQFKAADGRKESPHLVYGRRDLFGKFCKSRVPKLGHHELKC